jgi:precorrin-6x reductase
VAMIQHRDKAPTNALMAQAVRSCAERGIPYLVYSRFSDRKKERDPLIDFKEHNGFQRIDLPRYYVPLTSLGAAAFRLGLHHGLADHLPRPVLDKVRELRNSWYNRKLQQISQGS